MTMHPELAQLAHLQEVEQEAAALVRRMAGYVEKVKTRQTAVEETTRTAEAVKKAQTEEAAARRRMESDIEDLRQKKARYQAQLDSVQSDSQMKALEHQIAFCKQEIDRLEEQEFASLVHTESLETEQRTLDETIANLNLALENERTAAERGRAQDQQQLTERQLEREALRRELQGELLEKYDRIAAARKTAVAQVENQKCSACQMVVRPQQWNEIRNGAIHFCESCGRFLFYNPAVDLSDAIQLPPMGKKPAGQAVDVPSKSAVVGQPARED